MIGADFLTEYTMIGTDFLTEYTMIGTDFLTEYTMIGTDLLPVLSDRIHNDRGRFSPCPLSQNTQRSGQIFSQNTQ